MARVWEGKGLARHAKEMSAAGRHTGERSERKPRPRKPRCFMCERTSPGISGHTFRSGLRLDLCLRCTGRVVGIVEAELGAAGGGYYAVCVCGHESACHHGDDGDGSCMTCACPHFTARAPETERAFRAGAT